MTGSGEKEDELSEQTSDVTVVVTPMANPCVNE
jgi:hypothetical protein